LDQPNRRGDHVRAICTLFNFKSGFDKE